MDNKLSELSKPVAWLAIYHGDVYDEAISITRSVVEAQAERFGWESALTEITPLYSQEYVSALLAELEAKDKRITTVTEEREFWRERVEGAEKEREEFRRRFNLERSCLEDADKRIAELEAKMATPVRLPETYSPEPWMSQDPRGIWLHKESMKESIRAAGFTVDGDE